MRIKVWILRVFPVSALSCAQSHTADPRSDPGETAYRQRRSHIEKIERRHAGPKSSARTDREGAAYGEIAERRQITLHPSVAVRGQTRPDPEIIANGERRSQSQEIEHRKAGTHTACRSNRQCGREIHEIQHGGVTTYHQERPHGAGTTKTRKV